MGSYDEAEIGEFVGLFIINSLAKKYGKERVEMTDFFHSKGN